MFTRASWTTWQASQDRSLHRALCVRCTAMVLCLAQRNQPLQSLKGCLARIGVRRLQHSRKSFLQDPSSQTLGDRSGKFIVWSRSQSSRTSQISRSDRQVHHVDGDRANNHLDNLKYVSASENVRHSSYISLLRRSSGPARCKPVLWRPVGATSWMACLSVRAAAQKFGLSATTISRYCRSESATSSYEFKFQDLSQLMLPGEEWRPMVDLMSGSEV